MSKYAIILNVINTIRGRAVLLVKKEGEYKRGDVVYVSDKLFDEKNGVLHKSRPAVVIQNDIGNKHSRYLIVSYASTQCHKNKLPTHVAIEEPPLEGSYIMTEHIQTVDSRYVSYRGSLSLETMDKIDKALLISLSLFGTEELKMYNLSMHTGFLKPTVFEGENGTFLITDKKNLSIKRNSDDQPFYLGDKKAVEQWINELSEIIKYL